MQPDRQDLADRVARLESVLADLGARFEVLASRINEAIDAKAEALMSLAALAEVIQHHQGQVRIEQLAARRIVIVNQDGTPVTVLQANDDGDGCVAVAGAAGRFAGQLSVSAEGGVLALYDNRGRPVAGLLVVAGAGRLDLLSDDAQVSFGPPRDGNKSAAAGPES